MGAEAGTLTFMVGGSERDVERARPVLDGMGRNVFHAGAPGSGQAAKICNNLLAGISMIAVSEAFSLARQLGLEPAKMRDILSVSSGGSSRSRATRPSRGCCRTCRRAADTVTASPRP